MWIIKIIIESYINSTCDNDGGDDDEGDDDKDDTDSIKCIIL